MAPAPIAWSDEDDEAPAPGSGASSSNAPPSDAGAPPEDSDEELPDAPPLPACLPFREHPRRASRESYNKSTR